MLNLRKQIDFNLLGDDGDVVNKIDFDVYFSEETSTLPPALRLAKILCPEFIRGERRRSFDETNQNSPPVHAGRWLLKILGESLSLPQSRGVDTLPPPPSLSSECSECSASLSKSLCLKSVLTSQTV